MLKIINKGAKSDLPFSPAIQVGDLVYISGQASVDHNTGKIISGTIEEEIYKTLDNVKKILNSINLTPDNIINVKAYVSKQEDIKIYNQIYKDFFVAPYPTRTTIVNALPSFLKFEIDCIAYAKETRKQAVIES
ncbi:MAG: putative reactive intermediate deaminase TdcF [Alphaproteobacteria bacterium MarineAlpha5_Bin5]|nr:MAG: putative reactive intermediate deaminase TdcF [Alphaproteobacteria bacterium MarineAlpha5_Bin5]PPR52669.1 MAG: putative reactive intermediate deaminase TdcF [Alphaproteobacteria bacterium MarineAlpha5_Bin4]|tara:strand:+ start:835 stop:1236 length:402 start_codon:yes stop_codon:yes gene_type:complete